jgi:hypothetical protein
LKTPREATAPESAKERDKTAFFGVADRLASTSDLAEQKRLKEELARMTFGEP